MEAFYAEAFNVRFYDVQTGSINSRFGEMGGVTLKFVPIRDEADFEGYPVHQLGMSVDDVGAVVAAAQKHGGLVLGEPQLINGVVRVAVRDPDGNTIEISGPV